MDQRSASTFGPDMGARLQAAIRAGDDDAFDRCYPERVREVARRFWTPLGIARRAAGLFAQLGARHVLDVGSGPGKFCLAAATSFPALRMTGIEQRGDLVAIATAMASGLGLEQVSFLQGNALDVDWSAYDGFYFFNPFGENLSVFPDERFDENVALSANRYIEEVTLAERLLARLAPGSLVVTYFGFGGAVPASFELIGEEACGADRVRLWIQGTSPCRPSECWRELPGGGVRRGRFFDTKALLEAPGDEPTR